jgi:hypothetical protein
MLPKTCSGWGRLKNKTQGFSTPEPTIFHTDWSSTEKYNDGQF